MLANHQVVFLINKKNNQIIKNDQFIQEISRHVPSLITSIDKAAKIGTDCSYIGKKQRDTTLFVNFVDSDKKYLNSQLTITIILLTNLSKKNARSKCLIVHFSQNSLIN